MSGQCYGNFLSQALKAVAKKRRGELAYGLLFLPHNATIHFARVARDASKASGFTEIDHPPSAHYCDSAVEVTYLKSFLNHSKVEFLAIIINSPHFICS